MDYEIIYSKRRTICIQVKADASVIVRAPFKTSKKKIELFVNQNQAWIDRAIDKVKSRPAPLEFSPEDVSILKAKAKEIIIPRVDFFSKLMEATPSSISINSAKKRYGSCSSKKSLNFSFRLALYPIEAIDYVVVHELAHLTEMNHSKKFWAIVERYMPDYKERKKLLK